MSANLSIASVNALNHELTSRIIALVFVNLKDTIPTANMTAIREAVAKGLSGISVTDGTTYSCILKQVASFLPEDGNPVVAVDSAITANPHLAFQIKEIASALSPIVIQTIRNLDVTQDEASATLYDLQEDITSGIVEDTVEKPYDIEVVELGALEDPEVLSTASAVAESFLPEIDRKYSANEYIVFSKEKKYVNLDAEDRAKLTEFLNENDVISSSLESAIVRDPADAFMFPSNIAEPKGYADKLTHLWERARELKESYLSLPDGHELRSVNISNNIDALLNRVAMALHHGHESLEFSYKNALIADKDKDTIYVYPWSYSLLDAKGIEEKDKLVKDFVRAKEIQNLPVPSAGWTVDDVVGSVDRVSKVLSSARKDAVMNQEAHTLGVVRKVCGEKLKDYPDLVVSKIATGLASNSDKTLQDIFDAKVNMSNEYFLQTMSASVSSESFSGDQRQTQAKVILDFLVQVAKDRIVHLDIA